MKLRRAKRVDHFLGATLLVTVSLVTAAGCGGSSTSLSNNGGDSGSDATAATDSSMTDTGGSSSGSIDSSGGSSGGGDSSADSGGDSSGGTDSGGGSEAGACTGANGSACENNSTNGLCEGGTCSACNDPTDDATCAAAYPPAALCLAGVCSPGNCRLDTDCPAGEICGASQPNFCGKCTGDAQCQADATYGAAFICNTTSGACVSSACTMNGKKCGPNAGDFCCALKCVPGNCCMTSDCTGSNQTCQQNQCTTCALVTNGHYYVDPKNGDDDTATGSSATGGACAFQTIARALEFIGPGPAAGTKIEVLNTATVVSPPEVFPIVVQKNVVIEGATAGTPSTIDIPTNTTGFTLSAAASGLNNLIIDGGSTAGSTGIVATTGSTATTTITNVEVTGMGLDGIDVNDHGVLSILSGVVSHHNGANSTHSGLVVQNNGVATITVNTGATMSSFDTNSQFGIYVLGAGQITIGGTLQPAVSASGNHDAGLCIVQTPGTAVPTNNVSNLQANGSVAGNGIHIYGGSSLTLRGSETQGNDDSGILVETYVNGTTTSDDVSKIDLGTAASAGGNTFQFATGAMPNPGAGICFDLTATAGQTLKAAGNIFEAANCATAADTLSKGTTCAGGVDYAITGTGTTNKIILTKCM
jgi:hypothetical protein